MPGLVIININDIARDATGQISPVLTQAFASLCQAGRPIFVLCSKPGQWQPTRGSLDQTLSEQFQLSDHLLKNGGNFTGFCYIEDQGSGPGDVRMEAITDLLRRHSTQTTALFVSSAPEDASTATKLGLQLIVPNNDEDYMAEAMLC